MLPRQWDDFTPVMQERNESLFYYVLSNNIEELLPIVHMPTVSKYCQTYGLMFKSLPRSLFICMKDKGLFLAGRLWPNHIDFRIPSAALL